MHIEVEEKLTAVKSGNKEKNTAISSVLTPDN